MATKESKNIEIVSPKNIWQGSPDAPVSLVLFGDYESKECAKAHRLVVRLLETYEGKIKFCFRHFPLTQIHQHAHKAAEAAVASIQEGKFWQMHNLLFNNQRRLGTVSLKEYAREAGVADKNFLPKLVDSAYGWTVRADLLEGLGLGVRDVPAFFINDELYAGKQTFDAIGKAITESAKRAKRKKAA